MKKKMKTLIVISFLIELDTAWKHNFWRIYWIFSYTKVVFKNSTNLFVQIQSLLRGFQSMKKTHNISVTLGNFSEGYLFMNMEIWKYIFVFFKTQNIARLIIFCMKNDIYLVFHYWIKYH